MIKKLDPKTINFLTANKSICSFSHIGKELLENALDAQATKVTIRLNNEGIVVEDNGIGIPSDQIEKVLEAGCSSKTSLHSFGYKGEALAAIANIAEVTVVSKDSATFRVVAVSNRNKQDTKPIATGTRVVVTNIFSDFPVRKVYFEKNLAKERETLVCLIKKVAYMFPLTEFCIHRGKTEIIIPKVANKNDPLLTGLKNRILETTSTSFFQTLQEISVSVPASTLKDKKKDEISTFMQSFAADRSLFQENQNICNDFVSLVGFTSKLTNTSWSRSTDKQTVFVNKKLTKNSKLQRALNAFYNEELGNTNKLRFPFFVFNLEVPESVKMDVFFSPLKDTVLIENEDALVAELITGIKKQLVTNPILLQTEIFHASSDKENQTPVNKEEPTNVINFHNFYCKKRSRSNSNINDFESEEQELDDSAFGEFVLQPSDFEKMRIVGQFNLSFILVKLKETLFVVDQHAADEIANFFKILREKKEKCSREVQKLVVKKELHLEPFRLEMLEENLRCVKDLGIEVEIEEQKAYLSGFSSMYSETNIEKELVRLLQKIEKFEFSLNENSFQFEGYLSKIASQACRSSVMIGDPLNEKDMKEIIFNLSKLEKPWNCPHGRPTIRLLNCLSSFN